MAMIQSDLEKMIARDSTPQHRQLDEQQYIVKSLENGNVTLKFVKNSFRKHFILPSKKGKSAQQKGENRAFRRYTMTTSYYKAHQSRPAANALKVRFNMASDTNAAVDLTTITYDLAFATIAKSALGQKWDAGALDVEVDFGRPCVFLTKVNALDDSETKHEIATSVGSKMQFRMEKSGEGTFSISHGVGV